MNDADEDRDELAHDRTDLAEDRTVMANERTFAGWFRTGFAAVGIGLGFHALFLKMEPWWAPRAIASIFLLVGMFVLISAERRACAVHARLQVHKAEPEPNRRLFYMTIVSCIAIIGLLGAIWFLRLTPENG